MLAYKVQQLGLPYGYSVPLSHNYVAAAIKQAEQDLLVHRNLSNLTMSMLSLINVGLIVNDNGSRMNFSDEYRGTQHDGDLGKTILVRGATPVVFASTLVHRPPDKDIDKPVFWDDDFSAPVEERTIKASKYVGQVVSDMAFDPASNTVERIFVRDTPPVGTNSEGSRFLARVSDYKVGIDRVVIRLESEGTGWARLAHAWYPALQITLNGAPIAPMQDVMGQIVVPVKPGINEYIIHPVFTGIRRATLGISAAVLLAIWGGTWRYRRYSARSKKTEH